MTEQEAMTKWCPHTRLDNETSDGWNGSWNRLPRNSKEQFNESACCVGSSCMAWRWTTVNGNGYCGLAGPMGK